MFLDVAGFGRSRLDYGHFHGRLLLRRPLPPSTAKNSLARSSRLILRFGPPARSHMHVSAGRSGHRSNPFMENQLSPGRSVVIAKRLFSDVKGKRFEPRPCQSSRCSRPEKYSQASYAQTSTKPRMRNMGGQEKSKINVDERSRLLLAVEGGSGFRSSSQACKWPLAKPTTPKNTSEDLCWTWAGKKMQNQPRWAI